MFARELAEHGMIVVGVDSRFDDFHGSSDGVTFVEGDYLALSDGLGEFDIVLALDVVEHFRDECAVAGALSRNLKADGRLIVSVPAYRWLWSSHDRINDHFSALYDENVDCRFDQSRAGGATHRIHLSRSTASQGPDRIGGEAPCCATQDNN